MNRIVFLGPPGAGKGTQAREIARELGVPHLSTGDLLRGAAAARTHLGMEADKFMRAGQLVPDHLTMQILFDRLDADDARRGFLLDGFPRNLAQAGKLAQRTVVDHAVAFEIPESVLVERLTLRRHCPTCGTVYNLSTRPPKVAGRCDNEGMELVQRNDDREDAVRTRLHVFREQTEPLLQYYQDHSVLRRIDATGSVEVVADRIRTALAPVRSPKSPPVGQV